MTILKNARVYASEKCKAIDRGKIGKVFDVVFRKNSRFFKIVWDNELNPSEQEYQVGEIREIKTIVSINQKHEIQRQKDYERKKELRVFDEEKIAELPAITFCDEEKRVVSRKLDFKLLSYELKITPEMKANIEAIHLEVVQVSFSDEDMDTVVHHLDLYNQIYKEVSGRFNAQPLNEYSGELAILTARINVRSLL
jgi:hypothetical protein